MNKNLLKLLLKPIAAFCVRRSLKLQEITDVFKEELVIAAKNELAKKDSKITSSRLSVMTGVHRKDIKTIVKGEENKSSANIITRVIGQWLEHKNFTTKSGKAKVLSVLGGDSDFSKLVASVSSDLNPYTVLFELERMGAVKKTSNGVRLEASFFGLNSTPEQSYELLSNDLNDLISSVEHNIHRSLAVKNLHLKTEYDKIPIHLLPKVKEWVLENGSSFHKKVRKFLSEHDADLNKALCKEDQEYAKVSIGTFSFADEKNDGNESN